MAGGHSGYSDKITSYYIRCNNTSPTTDTATKSIYFDSTTKNIVNKSTTATSIINIKMTWNSSYTYNGITNTDSGSIDYKTGIYTNTTNGQTYTNDMSQYLTGILPIEIPAGSSLPFTPYGQQQESVSNTGMQGSISYVMDFTLSDGTTVTYPYKITFN
jgi:hypothetical protein